MLPLEMLLDGAASIHVRVLLLLLLWDKAFHAIAKAIPTAFPAEFASTLDHAA
jgi:hypothetical protein